jgi:iron complex transport system ATP-binding protein
MANNSLIEARNVSVEIGGKIILEDVSVKVAAGRILAVLGANGAGKSTLRKVLTGDLQPSRGSVQMNGLPLENISLENRARVRAVMPQDSRLNFPFTVLEVALLGRAPHVRGQAESKRDFEIVSEALKAVRASHLADRLFTTLSGGERQRVQLARVLAQIWEEQNAARFLLLDEPVSNLDLAHQHLTLQIARKMACQKVGVLVILHDLNLAAQYADEILLLKNGKVLISAAAPREVLTPERIFEAFQIPVLVLNHPTREFPLIISA